MNYKKVGRGGEKEQRGGRRRIWGERERERERERGERKR